MIEDVFYRLPRRIASAFSVRVSDFLVVAPGDKLPARLRAGRLGALIFIRGVYAHARTAHHSE